MTEEKTDALRAEPVEVVSIKFRNRGKAYYFDPAGFSLSEGAKVVVETAKGLEMGDVVRANHWIEPECVVQPLRCVVRTATADDLRIEELCREREREAFVIGKQKIADHGLEMKLVDVECSFEGNKILFFFSSDGRVDFRELVKDLAGVFRTRIELRQIGVRDEARMLGGLGICGRPFCCGSFMEDFAPVSTKMAKTQSMSLNPAKISGCCGRLMCCLRYEQAAYEELVKHVPKNGAFVETPDGYGNVTQVNVLRQTVKVKLDGPGDDSFHIYDADEVAAIPGGRRFCERLQPKLDISRVRLGPPRCGDRHFVCHERHAVCGELYLPHGRYGQRHEVIHHLCSAHRGAGRVRQKHQNGYHLRRPRQELQRRRRHLPPELRADRDRLEGR